jgi:hypothetical protein
MTLKKSQLLISHHQKLTLGDLAEIWNQPPLKKLRNLSLGPKKESRPTEAGN